MKQLGLLLLAAATLAAQTPARRLVLISVDGLMARTVPRAETLGMRLPNLTEFRDHGAVAAGLSGVCPTLTYPSHTTIVTGRRPAEHGILSNTVFDPVGTQNGAWYWYSEMIKTPLLWDAAHEAGLTTAAVGWPVSVGARIDYSFPEYKPARTQDDALLYHALLAPGLLAEYEKGHARLKFEGEYFDDVLSDLAAFLIGAHKPNLLLVHMVDLDHDQHQFGPESPQALRRLERIDAAIGRIRKAVDAAGVGGETRWLIVSDHGFFPVEKAFHPQAFLAGQRLGATDGDPRLWRVATQAGGGSAAFISRDANDREAQALVAKLLQRMKDDGGFGIDRIMDRAELKRMGAWPNAFLGVSAYSGPCRSAFRGEADHDSGIMPIMIPG